MDGLSGTFLFHFLSGISVVVVLSTALVGSHPWIFRYSDIHVTNGLLRTVY